MSSSGAAISTDESATETKDSPPRECGSPRLDVEGDRRRFEDDGTSQRVTADDDHTLLRVEDQLTEQPSGDFVGWWWFRRRSRRRGDDPSDNPHQRNHWLALLFGQAIALTAASMNAASFTLVDRYAMQTQLFQLFWVYLLLSGHLFSRCSMRASSDHEPGEMVPQSEEVTAEETVDIEESEEDEPYYLPFLPTNLSRRLPLRIQWWIYLLMSLLDVLPNFLVLYSYGYTSLTSTTLLGSLTVPSTMLFTRLILSKNFRPHHYVGVLLCVLGGSLTIYTDSTGKESPSSQSDHQGHPVRSHYYVGDILAATAALLYGLGDAIAEYTVKNLDRFEYLGMLGLFGMLLTGMTFPFLEHQALQELVSMPVGEILQVCALLLWYILSVLLYYVLETKFLVSSDATFLNLSMQSVNLWAVVFTVAAHRDSRPPLMFLGALTLVFSGVYLYEMGWSCFCCWFDGNCKIRRRRRLSEVEIVHGGIQTHNYQSLYPR